MKLLVLLGMAAFIVYLATRYYGHRVPSSVAGSNAQTERSLLDNEHPSETPEPVALLALNEEPE